MKKTINKIITKIKEGMLREMWQETKWIYQYARKYHKHIILYTLLGLLGTGVSLIASLLSRDLVDIITGYQTGRLIRTFVMMITFAVANVVVTQLSTYASNWISLKVDTEIKADIFSQMLTTDWESIASYHTGDLLVRWSGDASAVSSGLLNWIPNLIINLFRFIGAFAIVVYHDVTFALIAMLGVPVTMLMSRTLMKRMRNNNQRSAAMNAKMSGFNQESFSNIQTIKAFDLIKTYTNRLRSLQGEYISMKLDFQRMSMLTSILMSLIGLAVTYSSYGWGIYRVWSGAISYGTMTLFLSLSGMLTGALNSLISLVPTAISLTTSAGRLIDILNMPQEDFSASDSVDKFYEENKQQGIGLCVSEADYTYHSGTQVFRKISISVAPREMIALVGPSGEGKTTMLRLLLSLLQPQSGETYLYGAASPAEHIPLSPATRKLFSYVPQGNTMFSGTIAENMRSVKPDATEEEIWQVLKLACAYDFVSKLPEGIHSTVMERGGGFSEGQAQRLSIARALLRKAPILLLDEATSALDVATERQVLRNIIQDDSPRICILTTHRPTVLSACNKVYKLENLSCRTLDETEIAEMLKAF
ncbi:MAG: ABC transporter ATP-binding protein [Lachnospiraceae bacterium]|nr:ABC transporter ATP-binding protein [Lachnospiraceae bacterium]